MSTPAVIIVSQYITAQRANELKQGYANFVDYVDREEAKINKLNEQDIEKLTEEELFYLYLDYMDDDKKQGELFTKDHNLLNDYQLQEVRDAFNLAQKNDSVLWQDVISFDNLWLEEQGIYNPTTGNLDEIELKNIVREAIAKMLELENMSDTAIWTAAIHHNTNNIHVHIATVEPTPSRVKVWVKNKDTNEWRQEYRGKRLQRSIEVMKSTVANKILDRSEQYKRIDELIKGTRKLAKEENIKILSNRKIRQKFLKALTKMPDDLRQWQYGYQSINDARPFIDEIVDVYLSSYHNDEMNELNQLLDDQVAISRRLYGSDSKHEQYKITKLDELKSRMGNVVLSEMRNYVKEQRKAGFKTKTAQFNNKYNWEYTKTNLHFSLLHLNGRLRKTFHEYKKDRNIDEFDRMLEGYER